MASNGGMSGENSVVRYGGASDPESVLVEVQSPAKNRAKGKAGRSTTTAGGLVLFERASGSWWNPKFDSTILETELLRLYFPQTRLRFQYALIYLVIACLAWCVFFATTKLDNWPQFLAGALTLAVFSACILLFTRFEVYERYYQPTSVCVLVVLATLLLAPFAYENPSISLVGTFFASVEVLLLLYTFIPLPLFLAVPIGITYSIVYEVLVVYRNEEVRDVQFIISKALLHLCLHLLGVHIFIMSQVRRHSNFWKVGQSVMARNELEIEKRIKQDMIYSLMPPSVADDVMKGRPEKESIDGEDDGRKKRTKSKRDKGEIIFRSFNMSQMDEVSILFADIVGFTKMSSNKTAEHLVGLLNDLFGRFDKLCSEARCEKISTLGDCYYCVAGCPVKQADHAHCCVKMGLGMIKAIMEFDEDNNEEVNMRVGVHTGTVLCGIVGTRRFKFDVWSNDVTLANIMESTGEQGMVHISESTYEYLKDAYEVRQGENVLDNRTRKVLIEHYDPAQSSFTIKHKEDQRDIKTYFILGPKAPVEEKNIQASNSVTISLENDELANDVAKKGETSVPSGAAVNHLERETSVNGVSPAAMLGRRHSTGFLESAENPLDKLDEKDDTVDQTTVPINESWAKQQARKDEIDHQIIKRLKEDAKNMEFFYRPPINICTLSFNSKRLEEDYRDHYRESQLFREESIASPRYHSFIEIVISLFIFIFISVCCFLVFFRSQEFIVVFVICLVLELLILVDIVTDLKLGTVKKDQCSQFAECMSSWWSRNCSGVLVALLPAAAVYSNLSCLLAEDDSWRDRLFCFCLVLSLLNFCNFSMLSSWFKSIVATIVGLTLLILLNISFCSFSWTYSENTNSTGMTADTVNNTQPVHLTSVPDHLFSGENALRFEIILDIILLLILIWLFNREFEINYRLSFHGSAQAERDVRQMQENKDQADWLLHNIIPEHVSDIVKRTSKYSKNHKDVGVIFATIVNFNEFYDEGFEGGREYLRVLNELVSDYEELLDHKRFKDVEKIKTISASFMAASGLNELSRRGNKHSHAHLFALMDFAEELQQVVARFNESIFNFNFILNIGYNFGEVTAGVIGTTKLLYDIWGDTVNIASRMYSTGEPNRIQVPEATVTALDEMFEFEYRGEIYVKGKGDMRTYLLKEKRPNATWD